MSNRTETPLVSVIVPVYNVEDYLDRCVSSIVNQSYPYLEIILVDDGSTDSSGTRCDDLAAMDSRITVIHSENRGLAGARNLGLTVFHGEWIVFVDSDDFIGPDHILNLLSTAVGSNSRITVTGYKKVSSTEKVEDIGQTSPSDYSRLDAEEASYIAVSPGQTMFSPSAWAKIYDASLAPLLVYPLGKYYEDHFVTYYVFYEAQSIVYENADDYYYTADRSGSIMHQCNEKIIDIIEGDRKLMLFSSDRHLKKVEAEITRMYFSHLIGTYARAIASDQPRLAERVFKHIKAERSTALTSPYAATSTKVAMILSLLPRPVFDLILRHQEAM